MNKTEAYETVLNAAIGLLSLETSRGDGDLIGNRRLETAINQVTPQIQRMRSRLDALRARRAGKPTCPKWALP